MFEKSLITDEDIAENIIAPEIESAIYALLYKSDKPIRYNTDGLAMMQKALDEAWQRIPLLERFLLKLRADNFLRKLGF